MCDIEMTNIYQLPLHWVREFSSVFFCGLSRKICLEICMTN